MAGGEAAEDGEVLRAFGLPELAAARDADIREAKEEQTLARFNELFKKYGGVENG